MAYTILNYDGTTAAVIQDGTTDITSSSIEFIGKGLRDWGEPTQQNLFYVLQNFANTSSPPNPTQGQLWYDTRPEEMRLKIYNGTSWVPSGKIQASNTPPTEDEGTLWFDSSNKQLKVKIDTAWNVVGPLGSLSGTDPTDPSTPPNSVIDAVRISDTMGNLHDAFRITVGGVTIAIISKDAEYIPASSAYSAYGFPKIYQGITLAAVDSVTLAGDPYFWTGRKTALPEFDRTINIGSKTKRISNVHAFGMQVTGNLFSTGTTYFGPSTHTSKPVVFAKTSNLSSINPRLGAIEFDGSSFYFTNMVEGQPQRQVPLFTQNLSLSRRLYVSMSGSDDASGMTPAAAKKTLKGALEIAETGDTIFIESGDYTELNPLFVPPYVSIIGDNLRRTIIRPAHNQLDIFHVSVGTYFFGMTFKGHRYPAHCFAFPCSLARASISVGGTVTDVAWMHSKTGYTSLPTVTVESPQQGGIRAVVTPGPLVNGGIIDVNILTGGEGYDGTTPIVITAIGNGSTGSGAMFNARVELDATSSNYGKIVAVDIVDPGSDYQAPVSFTITGGGATIDATAEVILGNGILRTFTVTTAGSGYNHEPIISIQPPPPLPNITSSPYVQNCSSITGPFDVNGRQIYKAPGITGNALTGWVSATNPGSPYGLLDVSGAGGGLKIDGDVLSDASVLRSFVADSFTQVNQGGIGHLIINRGYAQFVSCFTTFSSVGYWTRSGGFCNISNSVIDFGDVGVQSEGYYWTPYETGTLAQNYSSGVGAVNINVGDGGYGYIPGETFDVTFIPANGGPGSGALGKAFVDINRTVFRVQMINLGSGYVEVPTIDWSAGDAKQDPNVSLANFVQPTGVVLLAAPTTIRIVSTSTDHAQPQNSSIAKINNEFYTISAASKVIVSGIINWDLTIYPGLKSGATGNAVTIHDVSNISTGGLALEYVGSGVTYNALPRYGGIPNVDKQVIDKDSASPVGAKMNPGRVYYVTIDNTGNFKIGKFFGVNFIDGTVKLNYNSVQLSGLTGIGPFTRDGVPVGVYADEISDDPTLVHPNEILDHRTIPTQYAVRQYITQISTNVLPDIDITRNLGSSSKKFLSAWVDTLNATTLNGNISGQQVINALGNKPVLQRADSYNIKLGWNGSKLTVMVDSTDFGSTWPIEVGGADVNMQLKSLGVGAAPSNVNGRIDASSLNLTNTLNVGGALNVGGTLNVVGGATFENTRFKLSPAVWPSSPTLNSDISFYTGDDTFRQSIGVNSTGGAGFIWSGNINGIIASWNLATKDFICEGSFYSKGDVTAYFGSTSDIRLKSNIKNIDNALNKVSQLNGITFDWNDDYIETKNKEANFTIQKHDVGVIAQEVEAVLPEVVVEKDDGTKTVKYEKIIPLLIEAIKDLNAQVEALKQQLSNK